MIMLFFFNCHTNKYIREQCNNVSLYKRNKCSQKVESRCQSTPEYARPRTNRSTKHSCNNKDQPTNTHDHKFARQHIGKEPDRMGQWLCKQSKNLNRSQNNTRPRRNTRKHEYMTPVIFGPVQLCNHKCDKSESSCHCYICSGGGSQEHQATTNQ